MLQTCSTVCPTNLKLRRYERDFPSLRHRRYCWTNRSTLPVTTCSRILRILPSASIYRYHVRGHVDADQLHKTQTGRILNYLQQAVKAFGVVVLASPARGVKGTTSGCDVNNRACTTDEINSSACNTCLRATLSDFFLTHGLFYDCQ